MLFTSFKNYLLKTFDDSNENNWSAENSWGQFVNIEPQIIAQIKDTMYVHFLSELESSDKKDNKNELPRIISIPRIKSNKTLDLEYNAITTKKELEKTSKKNTKYTYISVTGIMICVIIYINTHL